MSERSVFAKYGEMIALCFSAIVLVQSFSS